MKAYKVFNPDWTCRGFKYEVGKSYEINEKPVLCGSGFHACRKVSDCFNSYSFDPANKVAEVELLGEIEGVDGDKQCTNKIKIIKEISWVEMLDLANTGKGNSGNRNSGYGNSGNRNSGNRNSGYGNSGNENSGNRNSGYGNSGNENSGDWNSGYWNSGDWNSGNRNSGNENSGDWNSCDHEAGVFNTLTPTIINAFNKPVDRVLWENSIKPDYFHFDLTTWVPWDAMSDKEKKENPQAYTCCGYLKEYDYKEAWKISFDGADKEDRDKAWSLPNFDPQIFYEITGIDYYLKNKK